MIIRNNKGQFAKGTANAWNKGLEGMRHHSEETKRKIGLAHKGKILSEEQKRKIGLAFKGQHHTEEAKRKISWASKNRIYSEEAKKNMSKAQKKLFAEGKKISPTKGKHHSEETRKKISEAQIGEKGNNWHGGISFGSYGPKFNEQLKEQIRKRDQYRCQQCFRHQNELKKKLNVHHIDFNKKNNDSINLISLCTKCHGQTQFDRNGWINYFSNMMNQRGLK